MSPANAHCGVPLAGRGMSRGPATIPAALLNQFDAPICLALCGCRLTKVLAGLRRERRVEVDGEVAQRRLQQNRHDDSRQWRLKKRRSATKGEIRDFCAIFIFSYWTQPTHDKICQDMHKILNVVDSGFLNVQPLKCKTGRSTSSRRLARPSKLCEIVVVLQAATKK